MDGGDDSGREVASGVCFHRLETDISIRSVSKAVGLRLRDGSLTSPLKSSLRVYPEPERFRVWRFRSSANTEVRLVPHIAGRVAYGSTSSLRLRSGTVSKVELSPSWARSKEMRPLQKNYTFCYIETEIAWSPTGTHNDNKNNGAVVAIQLWACQVVKRHKK